MGRIIQEIRLKCTCGNYAIDTCKKCGRSFCMSCDFDDYRGVFNYDICTSCLNVNRDDVKSLFIKVWDNPELDFEECLQESQLILDVINKKV